MTLLARREDFEPATSAERAAALYSEGMLDYPFFAERIAALRTRFAPTGQKLAIWGCGFGYLVAKAVAAGYDAFGYDASAYAITRAKAIHPTVAARFFVRNALVSGDMTPSRRDAGLPGAQRFPIVVTEDLLTCLTDAEIPTALTNLRGIASANLLHIVWPLDPTAAQDPRVTWKPIGTAQPAPAGSWRALLSPPDLVYDAVMNLVYDANGTV